MNWLTNLFGRVSSSERKAGPEPQPEAGGTLETSIRLHFAPSLREDGFKGTGRNYRRVTEGLISVVQIQGARAGGSFAVNLAVHPRGVPDVLNRASDPERPEDCELRTRLTEGKSDRWWSHDDSASGMDAAVADASELYRRVARPAFAKLSGPGSPLTTITADQLRLGEIDLQGFGCAPSRLARLLSRYRRQTGQIEEAIAFAELGVGLAGDRATSLRREMEDLLRELREQQP